MSTAMILAIVFFALAVMFPFLAFTARRMGKAKTEDKDPYSELKASVMLLNIVLPTVLFLLGAFGFTTYDAIVEKATRNVTIKVNERINKKQIDAFYEEIQSVNQQAKEDAEKIRFLKEAFDDTIKNIFEKYGDIFPKGTIVPYSGSKDDIDANYWAFCDGKNGTPDLRDCFIFGSSFNLIGKKGGSFTHLHKATVEISGSVTKRNVRQYKIQNGTEEQFSLEFHDHTFQTTRANANVDQARHLPPYYRLVYLMKIR